MAHQCPAPGCSKRVADDMLMCPRDWYRVPKAIRRAVWSAWANGAGAGSPAHQAAIRKAIESAGERP
jgi:hypothetical protein